MHHKVLFTSDIHGNEVQYIKFRDYAIETRADSIIIGGDLAPIDFGDRGLVNGQRHFLEKRLPKLLLPIKKKLHNSRIFLMMGNDDCATNLDVLEKNDPGIFHIVHWKRMKLTEEFDIVGYSFVPITPFGIKDWEKYDLSEVPENLLDRYEHRKRTNYNLSGYKTTRLEWEKFRFTPEREKIDSIQKDFCKDLFCDNANKTIYVVHTPPDNTNLDVTYYNEHIGSMALRLFIERFQPYSTLHGHVHETVERSGQYKQLIGETLCLTAGNHSYGSQLSVLVLDLYDPLKATRIII